MNLHRTYKVTEENGPRPAGAPDRCFYCDRSLGEEHKEDCVLRMQTVRVLYTIEIVEAVPEYWDQEMLEFHRNDSSWCASNLLTVLEGVKAAHGCLCAYVTAEYLGESDSEVPDNQIPKETVQ